MKWVVALIIAIGICIAWSLAFPTYTLRWRLTIAIETPQGVRSGSGVLESSFFRTFGVVGGASARLRGEAVIVDLGEGAQVVALLAHGSRGEDVNQIKALPVTAFTGAGWGWNAFEALKQRAGALGGKIELKPPLIPTLIGFRDRNDITLVDRLDPSNDPFEVGFRPRYRFKSASVEIVPMGWWPFNLTGLFGEPVTRGIQAKLPWWGLSNRPTVTVLQSARLISASQIDAESVFKRN